MVSVEYGAYKKTMAQLNFHPAPGLGNLAPGWLLLPYNPISPGTPMVASLGAAMPRRPIRIPRMGDLLSGRYVIPQNPILAAMGKTGPGTSVALADLTPGRYPVPMNPILAAQGGMGCATCGMAGLGDAIGDSISTWMDSDSPITGLSNVTFWGAVVVFGLVFFEMRSASFGWHKKNPRKNNPRHYRHRRNESVAMGFYDGQGRFHPIRASDDYDPEAVGEGRAYAPAKKRKKKGKKR